VYSLVGWLVGRSDIDGMIPSRVYRVGGDFGEDDIPCFDECSAPR
jgi:hypothetical protein